MDGQPAQFHGDPLITERTVVADTDAEPRGYLYAFDRETGEVRWKQALDGGAMSDVARRGGDLFVVSMRGDLVSFDLATGRRNWTFDQAPRVAAGSRPPGSPALAGDRLFFAARNGTVYALEASSGRLIWKRDLGVELNTSVTAAGGALYVGGMKGRIVKLSAATGAVEASLETGGTAYGTLVVAGGCVLALWVPDSLACLEPGLGQIRWNRSPPKGDWSSFKPLIWRDLALVGSEAGISGFRLSDGAEAASLQVEGTVRGLGLDGDAVLLAGTLHGTLYALPLPQPGGGAVK